ncbi:hypothetical protein SSX86_018468 [Deinandra increscens subsp. villosa]|uniref:MBD domain-containing protein n=1 Tax=Deinandra increscens subsp. villosa TaxID=3103831 RepID=A0AAP0GS64_9ASTR
MVNNLEKESFVPTGLEIILYNDQEARNWREGPNKIIAAEPLSWLKPTEVPGAVEGNGSRKRKRSTFLQLEVEHEKEFSLEELYKSNNIHQIILDREKNDASLDPQELLQNLKGWTIEKRMRPEKDGIHRVDKIYRHPKSKRIMRSIVEVKKFIEANSYRVKALDNVTGPQSQTSSSNQWEAISAQKTTWGTSFKSHNRVGLSLNSARPLHYQAPFPQPLSVQPAERSGLLKQQAPSHLGMRPDVQGCVRSFGASSSSVGVTCLDEIKAMVHSQVEEQIRARVEEQVAEKISQYEKTQREMVERMEGMQRLLMLGGFLPPSQVESQRQVDVDQVDTKCTLKNKQ